MISMESDGPIEPDIASEEKSSHKQIRDNQTTPKLFGDLRII